MSKKHTIFKQALISVLFLYSQPSQISKIEVFGKM